MASRYSARVFQLLERAYSDFHSHEHRRADPICLVHPYKSKQDQEVAALIAALLAYGNVKTILVSVERVLAALGPSPRESILDKRFAGKLLRFRHRFTSGEDVEILLHWVSEALRSHGSLETFFREGMHDSHSIKQGLGSFVGRFARQPLPKHLSSYLAAKPRGIKYLLSDPERGSACKRLNMFLRWVVRPEDGIDLGLWNGISRAKLMLPVDTHLLQTLHLLRWTTSKQANWKVAEAATERLRLYAPEDPIRYDFALCHLSMSGGNIRDYEDP